MAFQEMNEAHFAAALAAAAAASPPPCQAQAVAYDPGTRMVRITLTPLCTLSFHRDLFTEWCDSSDAQLAAIRLSARHDAIMLDDHDVQIDLAGVLRDQLPKSFLSFLLAQRGGSATSPAKAQAARRNGALGGRPRKTVAA